MMPNCGAQLTTEQLAKMRSKIESEGHNTNAHSCICEVDNVISLVLARKCMIEVAERWGEQRGVDVRELLFRLRMVSLK